MSNIITKRAPRIGRGKGGSVLKPLYTKPTKHKIVVKVSQTPAVANPLFSASTSNRMIPNAWQSTFGLPLVVFTQTSKFDVPVNNCSFPVQIHAVSLSPRFLSIRMRPIEFSITASRSLFVFSSESRGPRRTHDTARFPFPSIRTSSSPHGSIGRNSM